MAIAPAPRGLTFVFEAPNPVGKFGRRATQAYCSLNLRKGRAGVPHTVCPVRIIFPVGIPAWAPRIAPS